MSHTNRSPSAHRSSSRGNDELTENEKILINNPYRQSSRPRPLHKPLFAFPKASPQKIEKLLSPPDPNKAVFADVAGWVEDFFSLEKGVVKIQKKPVIQPLKASAPTIISLFYPDPDNNMRRPIESYLKRIQYLADLGEQTIIYVPPELEEQVKSMRGDVHWAVITKYKTIWDIPSNKGQYKNFHKTQKKRFSELEGEQADWKLDHSYNRGHQMAAYNAKAFVCYDAVIRNSFGSKRWIFMDAGLFTENGPVDTKGVVWGDMMKEQLDPSKFDRSIKLSGDTGVVFGGYRLFGDHGNLPGGIKSINHEWFTDPRRMWKSQHFAAGGFAGNSLGMLNYAVRYMQTFKDMDANNYYVGREEWIIPMVAVRYPNTIFRVPWVPTTNVGKRQNFPMNTCYSTYGDSRNFKMLPAIDDPVSVIYCREYTPRKPDLDGTGPYKTLDVK